MLDPVGTFCARGRASSHAVRTDSEDDGLQVTEMLAYTIRRLLQFIPTIVAISLIMFFLLNVLPGDAALMSGGLRQQTDPKVMEHMRKEWGLDKPLHLRYLVYIKGLA